MSLILARILIVSGHSIFGLIGCVRAQLQHVVHVSRLEGSSKSILASQIKALSLEVSPVSYNIIVKIRKSVPWYKQTNSLQTLYNWLLRRDLVLRKLQNSCPLEEHSYSISGVVSLPRSVLSPQDGLLTLVKVS